MSTAELRANKLYEEYHLSNEDTDVKRTLMFLLLTDTNEHKHPASYEETFNALHASLGNNGLVSEPCCYTQDEVCSRIMASEPDAIAGRGVAGEDVSAESLDWI